MRVKVCGVTSVADARMVVEAGADAVGVNLVPSSPRRVSVACAREITEAVGKETLVVLVVADLPPEEMAALREQIGAGCLQLHGDEPPAALTPLLPHAYKAVRIGGPADITRARAYGGPYILVDAKVPGALGGTGKRVDWGLVEPLARERKLVLAGGLTVENVAEAVRVVRPDCVDVASGVEAAGEPGKKDPLLVQAFVRAAKG